MPYSSIEAAKEAGFPTSAEGAALTLSQINKLADIYDAVKEGGTAENAMAVAWTQWKKLFRKEGDRWVAVEKEQEQEQKNIKHDAILQTLNRRIDGYCFKAETFEDNINEWDGTPIIYANDHPDLDKYDSDPEAALLSVGGENIGKVSRPEVDWTGRPKMKGSLDIVNSTVEKLIDLGKITLSTAFRGKADENKDIISVKPHHVLIFKEDKNNRPRDLGVAILNKKEDWVEFTNVGKIISLKNKSTLEKIIENVKSSCTDLQNFYNDITKSEMSKDDDQESKQKELKHKQPQEANMEEVEKLQKEIEVLNKDKDDAVKEMENIKTEFEEYKQKVETEKADALKVKRDAQWQEIKNKIPPGLTAKEEEEKALRQEWEESPHEFMMKLPDMLQKVKSTEEEGKEHPPDTEEGLKLADEMLEATGRSW